jgi:hypothetical protein
MVCEIDNGANGCIPAMLKKNNEGEYFSGLRKIYATTNE